MKIHHFVEDDVVNQEGSIDLHTANPYEWEKSISVDTEDIPGIAISLLIAYNYVV